MRVTESIVCQSHTCLHHDCLYLVHGVGEREKLGHVINIGCHPRVVCVAFNFTGALAACIHWTRSWTFWICSIQFSLAASGPIKRASSLAKSRTAILPHWAVFPLGHLIISMASLILKLHKVTRIHSGDSESAHLVSVLFRVQMPKAQSA